MMWLQRKQLVGAFIGANYVLALLNKILRLLEIRSISTKQLSDNELK